MDNLLMENIPTVKVHENRCFIRENGKYITSKKKKLQHLNFASAAGVVFKEYVELVPLGCSKIHAIPLHLDFVWIYT